MQYQTVASKDTLISLLSVSKTILYGFLTLCQYAKWRIFDYPILFQVANALLDCVDAVMDHAHHILAWWYATITKGQELNDLVQLHLAIELRCEMLPHVAPFSTLFWGLFVSEFRGEAHPCYSNSVKFTAKDICQTCPPTRTSYPKTSSAT